MRYSLAGILGIVITAVLFLLMHGLIEEPQAATLSPLGCPVLDTVQLIDKVVPPPEQPLVSPEPPPPPEPPPVPGDGPEIEFPDAVPAGTRPVAVSTVLAGLKVSHEPGGRFSLTRPARQLGGDYVGGYPRVALRKGVEGWAELVFTVLADGSVADVRVLGAEPPGYFEDHARKSAFGWRFEPALVDGEPVAIRYRRHLKYRLE